MPSLSEKLAMILADRYTIESEVGAGGMAVVYAAVDRKLGRRVAVKVLRPELASSIGPERFVREIELAARLQHPHILPVFEAGTADGIMYYVMPLVQDEALSDRIKHQGRLAVDEAVRIAVNVANALEFAHSRGIVHRDIKPDNILLSSGQAVVADFGIARALHGSGGRVTATGMAVGTPMYMSPEQALGSGEVDGRSDIYSLGCVLYEMLTGELPFKGRSLQSIVSQSVTAPRPRVRKVRREVPTALDEIIVKALAKDPEDRYQTADAFAKALLSTPLQAGGAGRVWRGRVALALALALALAGAGAWLFRPRAATSAVVAGAGVMAVLPFKTTGKDVEFAREGMVDLLSANLDAVGGIRILDARTVMQRWRSLAGSASTELASALALARDVGAGSVLTGSVVAAGPRVRITATLYSVSGAELARVQAEGAADGLLPLVDTLSLNLMRAIWRVRDPLPTLRVSAVTTGSLPAIRAYLQGEQHFRQSDWRTAAAAFSRALEADSTFALAALRLAWSYAWLEGADSPSPLQALQAGARYADRLPPRDRTIFGAMLQLFTNGSYEALDTIQQFVTRYPDDIDGWVLLGEIRFHGRGLLALAPEETLAPWDRALVLDPTLGPALLHPLEISLGQGDRRRYDHYLERLRSAGASDELRTYEVAATAAWGPPASVPQALQELLRRRPTALSAVLTAAYHSERGDPQLLASRIREQRGDAFQDERGLVAPALQALVLTGLGQVSSATRLSDSLRAGAMDSHAIAYLAAAPLIAGSAGRQSGSPVGVQRRQLAPGDPIQEFLRAVLALSRHDVAGARAAIDKALALDSVAVPRRVRGLLRGAAGWASIASGDTVAGIQRLADGIREVGFTSGPPLTLLTAPLRFEWAAALAARAETREEGIRRLRYGFDTDYEYLPLSYYSLAKTLQAGGNRQAAEHAYERFGRLWQDADSIFAPVLERARASSKPSS